ncbi:TAXI family TRAP transporter solute-binding subunit [Maritimibacter alkaliphilus]|uniref:TAXI family TRAP transporter solute-binding subunit n=1 Tax=Maritimibacter alkaliphilus TaxID=404236 RepID=UPI001C96AAC6|nr:TAXI family TRAP transporter solute-binding subunit [Maritimibacter alkaliphilus]MBY6092605.1 TAXI family TRAP transporter solute-binding subunit [Maritimibacter alkaliphilus]
MMKAMTIGMVLGAGLSLAAAQAGAQTLTLASGPSGGTWYPLGAALAKIIEEEVPGTRVSVVNGVTVANILGTNAGQYDLALSLSTSNVDAMAGTGEVFPAPQEKIRGIAGFYSAPYQMAVAADSDITSVKDFAGKVINPGVVGGATDALTRVVLELNDLSYDDMSRVERLSYADASMQLKDGHLDVFTGILSVPSGAIAEAALGNGVRLVPMSDETLAALQERNDGYVKVEIPAETYKGQSEAVQAVGTNNVLIANADLDPALIEKITKAIVEHAEELHAVNAALSGFGRATASEGIGAPLHPGAEAYYSAN